MEIELDHVNRHEDEMIKGLTPLVLDYKIKTYFPAFEQNFKKGTIYLYDEMLILTKT